MNYVNQHYQDTSGKLHFLSADDQVNAAAQNLPLPDPSWTPISDTQAAALQAPTPAQLWGTYQATAQAALDKSDITMLRCTENAVAVPPAWAAYRVALRAIIKAPSGDPTVALPSVPAYPAGT